MLATPVPAITHQNSRNGSVCDCDDAQELPGIAANATTGTSLKADVHTDAGPNKPFN